jgi:hypothetical protein
MPHGQYPMVNTPWRKRQLKKGEASGKHNGTVAETNKLKNTKSMIGTLTHIIANAADPMVQCRED